MIEQIRQSLSFLLPKGFAWPRDSGSMIQRILKGFSGLFDETLAFIETQSNEWLPQRTCTRIEDWEKSLGLPDKCMPDNTDLSVRREAIQDKLTAPIGALEYDDSSPASAGFIEQMCLNAGFTVTAEFSSVFRAGRNQVGAQLGRLGRLTVHLNGSGECSSFRVGQHQVGDRLRTCNTQILQCLLERIVPARFSILILEF